MKTLDDDDRMPWGKHKGRRLRDVPQDYWAWLLNQDWFAKHHDLYQYADCATDPKMTFEEAVRMFRRI